MLKNEASNKRNQQMLIIGKKFELFEGLYTIRSGVNSSVKSSQLGMHVVKQLSNLCTCDISEIYYKGFIVPSFILSGALHVAFFL